jgi:transposase
MPFAALDLHRKEVEAVVLDDRGAVVHRQRFPATREAIRSFARRHLSRQHRVALEATTNTWAVADLLRPFCAEVVISNPLRTRAIASAKIKTDKVDATVLAQLLRLDYLPSVWAPDEPTRALRRDTTERACLVADRTRIKNRIHAILHQRLIPPPAGDLFSDANLRWLAALDLDEPGRQALRRQLQLLAMTEDLIAETTQTLAVKAHADPRIKLLMTLPGVDFTVAQTLLAALGDITRFDNAGRAAAYLGLVPSTYQSGEHCYHGRITKQGRGHARWMMVEAAQHLDQHPGPLGVFFRRIARKKNRNVAVVATARKLVTIAWHMLKNNEPYRYAVPSTTAAKFARLRIRATGAKRKGGLKKGEPRPAQYGKGRTKAIPALGSVYVAEQLPALPDPAAGEQRLLDRDQLTGWAAGLHRPERKPRGARATTPAPAIP